MDLIPQTANSIAFPERPTPSFSNPAIAYLRTDLGDNVGRQNMYGTLGRVAKFFWGESATVENGDWGAVRAPQLAALKAVLVECGRKETTVNNYLSAVRGVLKYAFIARQISADERMMAEMVELVKAEDIKHCRALTTEEVKRLLDTCLLDGNKVRGLRDAAAIALGVFFGLRACEVVGLDIEKFQNESVEILGKGNRVRSFTPSKQGVAHTSKWAALLGQRGIGAGSFIFPIGKGDVLKNTRRITTKGLNYILAERAKLACIEDVSWHDLRATFATTLFDLGLPGEVIQFLLGHADPKTTAVYDKSRERRANAELAKVDQLAGVM